MPRAARRAVLGGVAVLALWLVVAVALLFLAYGDARRGVRAVGGAQGALSPELAGSGDLQADLVHARRSFDDAAARSGGPLTLPLRLLPVVGRQVRSFHALSNAAAEITRAGADAARRAEAALRSAPGAQGRVGAHGDVTGSNLLLRGDRLCGVIDFGCSAVGDPACDLTPAWTMFEGTSRERFKAMLPLDNGSWARARGWALWKALIAIPGRPADDPARTGARFGWRWDAHAVIDHVIADHRATSRASRNPSPTAGRWISRE